MRRSGHPRLSGPAFDSPRTPGRGCGVPQGAGKGELHVPLPDAPAAADTLWPCRDAVGVQRPGRSRTRRPQLRDRRRKAPRRLPPLRGRPRASDRGHSAKRTAGAAGWTAWVARSRDIRLSVSGPVLREPRPLLLAAARCSPCRHVAHVRSTRHGAAARPDPAHAPPGSRALATGPGVAAAARIAVPTGPRELLIAPPNLYVVGGSTYSGDRLTRVDMGSLSAHAIRGTDRRGSMSRPPAVRSG
jgi:hypothetical protein